ncbi:hypothetical protein [Candidatus Ornithobacterium hominis]|uniref:hypothetical protein n=1 Tax=Candidatus Ornithobacterium hominis TaxID=2497989 RepID=UPI000E5BF07B|nr:hypothetical protein [Candidatus Ornithobacterium hominis]
MHTLPEHTLLSSEIRLFFAWRCSPVAAWLRLAAAGYHNYNNGSLNNKGSNGEYWSSSANDSNNAHNMNFNSGNSNTNNDNRANGNSVRCLKE